MKWDYSKTEHLPIELSKGNRGRNLSLEGPWFELADGAYVYIERRKDYYYTKLIAAILTKDIFDSHSCLLTHRDRAKWDQTEADFMSDLVVKAQNASRAQHSGIDPMEAYILLPFKQKANFDSKEGTTA